MAIRRIIYACVLAGAAFFSILYPFWFSSYLFLLLLLLLPFDLIISLPGMLSRRVVMASPRILECGEDGLLVLTTIQDSSFPARGIKIWLKISGDDFTVWRRIVFGAENGNQYEVIIDTSRSGLTFFEAKRIWIISIIGLFCIPSVGGCKASVLILPPPIRPPYTVALPRGVILRPKPGGGFSEDYDLRPYRKGDPIRSVHWKVSAKFNSLIIREPLIPPAHSRLLHATQWSSPKERDLILGRLRWVSDYLLKWDLAYFVRLGDDGPIAEITNATELVEYLYLVLGGNSDALKTPATIPIRFAWVFRVDAS